MKYFIKNHQEEILVALGLIFVAFIATYFVLSMKVLAESTQKASTIDTSRFQPNGFNLGEAKQLDFHGLDK